MSSLKGTFESAGQHSKHIVASYGRSGTNFMIRTLRDNFGIHCTNKHDLAFPWNTNKESIFYIVRDPRYTLVSWYNLLQTNPMNQTHLVRLNEEIQGMSFSNFIMGGLSKSIDKDYEIYAGVEPGMFSDPVASWVKHYQTLSGLTILTIKYEDFVKDFKTTVQTIQKTYCLDLLNPRIKRTKSRVGPNPTRKGVDIKGCWDTKSLKHLSQVAEPTMVQLGYLL